MYMNRTVRTIHFTDTTGDAMVFVAFVVGHRQLTPETVEHFQGSPVLRIFFSSLGGEKFPEGNAHSFQ